MLLASFFGGILWFFVDLVFFDFKSVLATVLIYVLSEVLVLFVILKFCAVVEEVDLSTVPSP
jgi:hypothetical protein